MKKITKNLSNIDELGNEMVLNFDRNLSMFSTPPKYKKLPSLFRRTFYKNDLDMIQPNIKNISMIVYVGIMTHLV